MAIKFHRDLEFEYGRADAVSPLVRRIVASNPSPFSYHGTGTYVVGHGQVAVIDPGPDDQHHVDALLHALRGETIKAVLVTHTHIDHSPATPLLKAATGAPVYAYGPHPLPAPGLEPQQGGDTGFAPDHLLADGDTVTGPGWSLEALYTPGHISNHLCFALPEERTLFSGDHVMGWSTSVISPPDGSMGDYFASLRKLLPRDDLRYLPTHGPAVPAPQDFVRGFIEHREDRERQILACLASGPQNIPQMVAAMYRDVAPILHPAAARSVHAHLIHMAETGRVASDGPPAADAIYRLPGH